MTATPVVKDDHAKERVDLVPIEGIKAAARAFAYGANKYYANSWRTAGRPQFSRVYASVLRHLFAWYGREDIDPESGLHHLDHALSQLMMLQTYATAPWNGQDDRYIMDQSTRQHKAVQARHDQLNGLVDCNETT
jgi:hypothetical protein